MNKQEVAYLRCGYFIDNKEIYQTKLIFQDLRKAGTIIRLISEYIEARVITLPYNDESVLIHIYRQTDGSFISGGNESRQFDCFLIPGEVGRPNINFSNVVSYITSKIVHRGKQVLSIIQYHSTYTCIYVVKIWTNTQAIDCVMYCGSNGGLAAVSVCCCYTT